MSQAAKRSLRLAQVAKKRIEDKKVYNLSVLEGETKVLSPTSPALRESYEAIKVSSIEELKEVIGVPKSLKSEFRSPAIDDIRRFESAATRVMVEPVRFEGGRVILDRIENEPPRPTARARFMDAMSSRTLNPELLTRDVEDPDRAAAVQVARAVISDYLYSNTPVPSPASELVSAYLSQRAPLVFAAVLGNISVANGATLRISSGTLAVYANQLRLYGSGKIECDGPTTFDVKSVRGNIEPNEFTASNDLFAEIPFN